MAKIKIEIDDKASKPLSKIDKEAKNVDDSLEDVSKEANSTSASFNKMAVAAAAVAAAMTVAVNSAIEADRAMFGLNEETRKYIRSASEAYGVNETIIAQYTRLGQSAGLAGGEIATMIDQAVALGRLYPTESTEEMVDNLREFYRTGQDAGYITDVLESAFKTTKLETISFADKMAKLEEITGDVNEQFAKTKAGRYDRVMTQLANATTDFGNAVLDLLEGSGALWVLDKALNGLALSANGYAQAFALARANMGFFGTDVAQAEADLVRLAEEAINIRKKLGGSADEGDIDLGMMTITGESSFDEGVKAMTATVAKAEEEMVELGERYITDFEVFSDGMWQSIEYGATSAFRNMLDGAENWKDMMGDILKDILAQFFQIYVVKQAIAGFSGIGLDSLLGQFAQGGAFQNGVQKFASGGVVSSPTIFPMANGAGLMGEAGAEAIMPLTRMSNGNLGVEAEGAATVVNVNNYGNDNVSVSQDGNNIDIVISQIAQGIQRGTNSIGDAIESRYGIRKQ